MSRAKRLALAVCFALALAVTAAEVVLPSACAWLTPDNWFLYWWYGCDRGAAGGGGSGAGD